MGNNTFRDWIPAGEDTGAQGKVYQDFVPAPVPHKKEEIKVEKVVSEFKCPVCQKVLNSRVALMGHSRSHKK